MRSSFEGFIETNSTVQSKFNLVFWSMSYNIFWLPEIMGPTAAHSLTSHFSLPFSTTTCALTFTGQTVQRWKYRTQGPSRPGSVPRCGAFGTLNEFSVPFTVSGAGSLSTSCGNAIDVDYHTRGTLLGS
jgi:hypothetical protein